MGKDFDSRDNDGSDKNINNLNYNDEMGRKTVGNLLSGLDEDAPPAEREPAREADKEANKPVVRAVRLNSQKANREKINNSFYDEDRVRNDDDTIVRGFKEAEEEPEEDIDDEVHDEDVEPSDEELANAVRTRRPNILKDESDEELDSRERYRKQFLEGYTDHERKRLDLGLDATSELKRKSADELDERVPPKRNEAERKLPPKRQPKDGNTRKPKEDEASAEQRPRRRPESEEEAALMNKRSQRKERPQAAAATSARPSSGAPIFKILAVLFVILIGVIVFLVISLNSANNEVDRLEAYIEQFDSDVEELGQLRARNAALEARNDDLTDESNLRLSQIEELERQLRVQDTDPTGVPGAPSEGTTAPEGTRTHTVQSGETLYRISVTYFGHARAIDAIMQASGLTSTNIQPGDTLNIPPTY